MRKKLIVVSSMIMVLLSYKCAEACWCRHDPEEKLSTAVAKEFQNSRAVFSGEIVELSKGKIKVKVNKRWKGEVAEEIVLSSLYYVKEKGQVYVEVCDYPFGVGRSYLIYSDSFENVLQVYGCSRTQPLNEAERDMKVLDELSNPKVGRLPSNKSKFQLSIKAI